MKNDNNTEIFSEEELSEMNKKLKSVEDVTLPENLKAEKIKELIDSDTEKSEVIHLSSRKRKNRRLLKAISVCAACAVAVTSLAIARPWAKIPPKVDESVKGEEPIKIEDYTEIENMFLEFSKNYKKSQFSFSGIGGASADKSESVVNGSSSFDAATGTGSTNQTSSSNHGTTNEQVEGVNEADIIKNDGKYIYAVSHVEEKNDKAESITDDGNAAAPYIPETLVYSGAVSIIEPQKNGKMKTVSEIKVGKGKADLDGYFEIYEIYVSGDRLIVLSTFICNWYDDEVYNGNYSSATECCSYVSNYSGLMQAVSYDISDKANPKEEWRIYQSGEYISSRLIGDELVLVSLYRVDITRDSDAIKNSCIPETAVGGNFQRISSSDICVMESVGDSTYLVASVLNVNDENTLKTKAVLGGGSNVYCTSETLYVTNREYTSLASKNGTEIFDSSIKSKTQIYKFDISDNQIKYLNCAKIDGTALNQFSIDEYNGNLRIATTSGTWGENLVNQIYVLDENLETLGVLKNIAKGEKIQSVRFMGETAYVVTFEQTDPLFVVNLSNPESPVIEGELKIPGYSAYLHPVGDGLVLGVGVDGDEDGSNDGFKASLFDVSNPNAPKECAKFTISGVDTDNRDLWLYSEAYSTHKALCWDSENKIMYIPFTQRENIYASTDYSNNIFKQFTGVIALKVSESEKSLERVGQYIYKSDGDEQETNFVRATYIYDSVIAYDDLSGVLCSFDKATQKQVDCIKL